MSAVTLREALGLRAGDGISLLREASIALRGAPHVPPSRWDRSSLALIRPRLGVPMWRGRWVVPRRVVLTNLFNHRQTPVTDGWSVRRTQVLDHRGGRSTYDSHNGTDLCVPIGTLVVAPASGVVVRVWSEFNRGGLKVAIDHGGGLLTSCAHLARALVVAGQRVVGGEPIARSGYAGLDGLVTFPFGVPHVHFNVWLDGEPVDPFARPGEVSLWADDPPRPPTGPGPTATPTDWDRDAVSRELAACLVPATRRFLGAIADPTEQAGALVAERNYYPTRFPARCRLVVDPHPRTPRLSLPFSAQDVDGVVFADELEPRPSPSPTGQGTAWYGDRSGVVMSKIRIYKTNTCPYCDAAMAFLDQKGLKYEAIDCSRDPATRKWLVETTGRTTVPQIFVGEHAIGGYTDLRALDASGEFQKLLVA